MLSVHLGKRVCIEEVRSEDWWVCVGKIDRVGGCGFPSCITVVLTSPDIVEEFSANVYQGGLNIGDDVYIVCIERSGSNKLMAFTKEMLNLDIYSWFKY